MTQSKRRGGALLAMLVSCLALLPTGCGSMLAFNMENRPTLFGGTQIDLGALQVSALVPFALVDLPMSLALDTALLPYALALEVLPDRE